MKYISIYSKSIKRVASPFDHPELCGKLYLKEHHNHCRYPYASWFNKNNLVSYKCAKVYADILERPGRLYIYAWKCMDEYRAWCNGLWLGQLNGSWTEHFNWVEDTEEVSWIRYHSCTL